VDLSIEVHWMVWIMTLQAAHATYWCYLLVTVFNFFDTDIWTNTVEILDKTINWKHCGKKWSSPGLKYNAEVCLGWLWKATWDPIQYERDYQISLHDLPVAKTVTYLALLPTFLYTDLLEDWMGNLESAFEDETNIWNIDM
jgi:hypothetical protein